MVNPNRFYTYAYLREDKTPYYIGKGQGNRVYKKNRRVRQPKDKSKIIFLKQNLIEEQAFKHEIYMIAVFGRKDLGTGILRNKTDGGKGTSNHGTPEQRSETARKIQANKTPEQRSEIARKREASKTPEQRSESARKMGETNKGKKWWNDNCGNSKKSMECPGEGWVLGRGKLKVSKTDPESN